ncbi:hypothetical protein [Nocardioides sp. cx-173]|uniref:hypothetical protein n=1 Tax=Nocardioides sp. cx-173 TaxID=2898796 RepID=UPI001E47E8AA|nr:hypothetical protein [Nocardioides sp. cx-173]MCD4525216.1 hypothetical protein [Nocardioides sp. cx-173]UGB40981.1 hypothetical protein LQ940_16585 [Nocardioides sp. cx-173]
MTDAPHEVRYPTPSLARGLDIFAKGTMLLLLVMATINPEWGNLEGKAANARTVGYSVLAFSVPAVWYFFWRDRASFPWVADLLVTITCFSDTLGNRLDLYDLIWWFDDWMHFVNTGLLAAAFILLTLHRSATLGRTIERALAFGVTAALAWEIAEYFAFVSKSSERAGAYDDTLGDLALGTLGVVMAALIVHLMWQQGRLRDTAPQLTASHSV